MGLGPTGVASFLVEDPGSTGGGGDTVPTVWYGGYSELTAISTPVRVRRPGFQDKRPRTGVRLLASGGQYTDVGSGFARGIVPEGISLSSDKRGPTTCSFKLRRDGNRVWPDLTAFAEAEFRNQGLLGWGGRLDTSPGDEDSVSVTGKGWQYDLDLDMFQQYWVHRRLSDWRNQRDYRNCNIATFSSAGNVSGGTFGWANGVYVVNNSSVGITLDLGEGLTAKRIVVSFTTNAANNAFYVTIRSHSTEDPNSGSSSDAYSNGMAVPSSPLAGTFSTGYRYVSIYLTRVDGSSANTGADHVFKVTDVSVFADAAYESGNKSILVADDVVKDARDAAPRLSSSNARIGAPGLLDTGQGIPHLTTDGYATPRSVMDAVNAYHNWNLGVDAQARVFFEARSEVPVAAVGSWRGASLTGLSSGTSSDVYNRVIVEGQDGWGTKIRAIRTATSPLLDRLGLTRTAKLTVSSASTAAILEFVGDVWLAEKVRTPFSGNLKLEGIGGARRIGSGAPMHPFEFLELTGRRVWFLNVVDPDTGGIGRTGEIASVQYDDDGTSASVQIDNDYTVLETLLARFSVLQDAMVS